MSTIKNNQLDEKEEKLNEAAYVLTDEILPIAEDLKAVYYFGRL